jgi:putative transposase
MDETYLTLTGEWRYLARAVDKMGQTIDCLLTEQRDEHAATRFLTKAIRRHGVPETIPSAGSEANAAAIRSDNDAHGPAIIIRQVKYLNHVVEQDHRGVKRITRPLLGGKSCGAAQCSLAGIERLPMLRKGQIADGTEQGLTPAQQFYALAASSPTQQGSPDYRSTFATDPEGYRRGDQHMKTYFPQTALCRQ